MQGYAFWRSSSSTCLLPWKWSKSPKFSRKNERISSYHQVLGKFGHRIDRTCSSRLLILIFGDLRKEQSKNFRGPNGVFEVQIYQKNSSDRIMPIYRSRKKLYSYWMVWDKKVFQQTHSKWGRKIGQWCRFRSPCRRMRLSAVAQINRKG